MELFTFHIIKFSITCFSSISISFKSSVGFSKVFEFISTILKTLNNRFPAVSTPDNEK